MADYSVFTHEGTKRLIGGQLDIDTDTFKLMLCSVSTRPLCLHTFVDMGDAQDFESKEISVTNYTPGYGSSSRKSFTCTIGTNSSANCTTDGELAVFAYSNVSSLTWTALGTGATIRHIPVIRETGGSDATSPVLAVFDVPTGIATNGGDLTVQFKSAAQNGNFRWFIKLN